MVLVARNACPFLKLPRSRLVALYTHDGRPQEPLALGKLLPNKRRINQQHIALCQTLLCLLYVPHSEQTNVNTQSRPLLLPVVACTMPRKLPNVPDRLRRCKLSSQDIIFFFLFTPQKNKCHGRSEMPFFKLHLSFFPWGRQY